MSWFITNGLTKILTEYKNPHVLGWYACRLATTHADGRPAFESGKVVSYLTEQGMHCTQQTSFFHEW